MYAWSAALTHPTRAAEAKALAAAFRGIAADLVADPPKITTAEELRDKWREANRKALGTAIANWSPVNVLLMAEFGALQQAGRLGSLPLFAVAIGECATGLEAVR